MKNKLKIKLNLKILLPVFIFSMLISPFLLLMSQNEIAVSTNKLNISSTTELNLVNDYIYDYPGTQSEWWGNTEAVMNPFNQMADGFFVSRSAGGYYTNQKSGLLIKFDVYGNVEWYKTTVDSLYPAAMVAALPNEESVMGCYHYNYEYVDFFSYDKNGDSIHNWRYNPSENVKLIAMKWSSGLWAVGDIETATKGIFILKMDANDGSILASNTWNLGVDTNVVGICSDANGGLYLTGYLVDDKHQLFIAHSDSLGNIIASNVISDDQLNVRGVACNYDGNTIYLVSIVQNAPGEDKYNSHVGSFDSNLNLLEEALVTSEAKYGTGYYAKGEDPSWIYYNYDIKIYNSRLIVSDVIEKDDANTMVHLLDLSLNEVDYYEDMAGIGYHDVCGKLAITEYGKIFSVMYCSIIRSDSPFIRMAEYTIEVHQPLELRNFYFEPTSIDVSTSPGSIKFRLDIEALSGFDYGRFLLVSPSGIQSRMGYIHYPRELLSGDSFDGTYETTVEFPQYSEEGEWFVDYVELFDNLGNWRDLYEMELINLGFPTRLSIISDPDDTTPSDLEDFNFFPTTINTKDTSQEIAFTATITDDLSGFSYGRFLIVSPSGSDSKMGYFHFPRELFSGDEFDGTYKTNIEFPQNSEEGEWFVDYVELFDNVGNWRDYYEMELISLGFSTKIQVVYNQAPLADAGPVRQANEGQVVIFDASGSSDPDGDPLQYRWDYDNNGVWDTSWSEDPTFQYVWNDDYSGDVTVEVTDGTETDTDTTSVMVYNLAPLVSIDAVIQPFPEFILALDVIEFYGSFFDPGIDDTHIITWDFGDGTIVYETLVPTYAYSEAGVYTVTLNVEDDDGGKGSTSFTITIQSPEEAAEEIIEDVEELDLQGKLEESFVKKLEVAQNSIEEGLNQVAIKQLNSFVIQVESMRGIKLTNEEANLLISAVQWLINNLMNTGL